MGADGHGGHRAGPRHRRGVAEPGGRTGRGDGDPHRDVQTVQRAGAELPAVGPDQCRGASTGRVAALDRVQGTGQRTQIGGGLCLVVGHRGRAEVEDSDAEQHAGQTDTEQQD